MSEDSEKITNLDRCSRDCTGSSVIPWLRLSHVRGNEGDTSLHSSTATGEGSGIDEISTENESDEV